MAGQYWVSLINPGFNGAGTNLTTATTAAISPQASVAGQDVAVIQAAGQPLGWQVGMLIRITARGFITTTGTSTTATILLRANKTNGGATFVTLATSNGITTGTTVLTGVQWKLEAFCRCTAIASSGNTVSTQGEFMMMGITSVPAAAANPFALTGNASVSIGTPLPAASGETAAAVDTTVFQGIQLAGTLAGANSTVACTQWCVETLN